jgi:hypothetical protein
LRLRGFLVPGSIGAQPELTGVETVEYRRQQGGCECHPNPKRMKRSSRVGPVGVFKQEKQTAEQADDDANQQNYNDDFQQVRDPSSGWYWRAGMNSTLTHSPRGWDLYLVADGLADFAPGAFR